MRYNKDIATSLAALTIVAMTCNLIFQAITSQDWWKVVDQSVFQIIDFGAAYFVITRRSSKQNAS